MTKGLVSHIGELQRDPRFDGKPLADIEQEAMGSICILEKSFCPRGGQWVGGAEASGEEVFWEPGGSGKGRGWQPRLSRGKK